MSSTSFFLVMVAVLALVVNVSAGSVTETIYTASTVCTGASQTTTVPTGCTSSGAASVSFSCSGNTITANTYTQANCAGTPATNTVQAGQCVANTQTGQSAILTCSAAWTIAPSVMLTALLGMISFVALKSF